MGSDNWTPPQCIHGRIVLGCPESDCPTQTAYLDQQRAAMAAYDAALEANARAIVRSLTSPDPDLCTEIGDLT